MVVTRSFCLLCAAAHLARVACWSPARQSGVPTLSCRIGLGCTPRVHYGHFSSAALGRQTRGEGASPRSLTDERALARPHLTCNIKSYNALMHVWARRVYMFIMHGLYDYIAMCIWGCPDRLAYPSVATLEHAVDYVLESINKKGAFI